MAMSRLSLEIRCGALATPVLEAMDVSWPIAHNYTGPRPAFWRQMTA
jgi:hypothetical protein